MDHIHSCRGGPPAIQIPCLVNPLQSIYSLNGGWLEYPEAQGFQLGDLRFLRWDRYPANKLASFLQDWLFFGLLRAVLPPEVELRVDDFLRLGDNGVRHITTSKLDRYLEEWERISSKLPQDHSTAISKRNEQFLGEARRLTYHLVHLPHSPGIHLFPPLPLECALSCVFLGQALSIANTPPAIGHAFCEPWPTGGLVAEQLELQGWCPFIVEGVMKSLEQATIYYFTTLGGPKPTRNHIRCTEASCIHTAHLDPRHTGLCRACPMVASPMTDITRAIEQGETPVLKYSPATKSAPSSLEVHLSDSRPPYVAISHVWCDGLGNPAANEIHVCQAERLQKAVDRIITDRKLDLASSYAGGYWWLDTLCVPPREPYRDEKRKAIAGMKAIYEQAESVLIIDSGLCACDDTTGPLEVLARLRLSNWIRRLWVYQEGYFAKSIYVLVGSTPRSWDTLVEAAYELPRDGYQSRIVWDLMQTYNLLFVSSGTHYPPTAESGTERLERRAGQSDASVAPTVAQKLQDGPLITERALSKVFREFSSRVATQPRDEPKCLSLFLGLDTVSVLTAIDEEEEERRKLGVDGQRTGDRPSEAGMATVLRLVNDAPKLEAVRPRGCFPPSIIFTICPRLRLPGLRWAPQSFLFSTAGLVYSAALPLEVHDKGLSQDGGNITSFERPSGVLCKRGQGLRIMFPGLLITKIDALRPIDPFFIVDSSRAMPARPGLPKFWRCNFTDDVNSRAWEGDIAPTNADSGKLAIIVGGFTDLESTPSVSCALVRIKGRCDCCPDSGGYAVERLGFLVGAPTPEYDTFEWVRNPWERVEGSWLPLNQMWCVD